MVRKSWMRTLIFLSRLQQKIHQPSNASNETCVGSVTASNGMHRSSVLLVGLVLHSMVACKAFDPSMTTTMMKRRRRSPRLLGQSPPPCDDGSDEPITKRKPDKKASATANKPQTSQLSPNEETRLSLPRTIENRILSTNPEIQFVLGVDEAGRGPLAGPVVAAAVLGTSRLKGIYDSKQTPECMREALYEQLIAQDSYAICVVDNLTIDRINILQATLLAMQNAVAALISGTCDVPIRDAIDIQHSGCYVVVGNIIKRPPKHCFALVDGNRLPDLPCDGQAVIKGDGSEYSIAAASILAKVSRDRLMLAYHEVYPAYNLAQHKGYPTAKHRAAITSIGPCPIHRMTFAPLKTKGGKQKVKEKSTTKAKRKRR